MTLIHCRACWQPMPALAMRCPRCGDLDKYRLRRAMVKLAMFLFAAAMILGLALATR